jgi:DNA polymerase-3 subunit alpha
MLGQYVTDHPLLAVKDQLTRAISMEMVELSGPEAGDGDILTLGGIVGSVGRKFTKRGEQYAVIRLEDLTGGVGVVVFPSLFEQTAGLIAPDRILLVKGRVDLRGRELQLVALEITEPHFGSSSSGGPVVRIPSTDPFVVDIPVQVCTEALIRRLKDLLASCPGSRPVTLCLVDEHGSQRLRLGEEFAVDGSAGLYSELRRLLGPGAVREGAPEPARV